MRDACSTDSTGDRLNLVHTFAAQLLNGDISREEAEKFLAGENPFGPKKRIKQRKFLELLGFTNLTELPRKLTAECFQTFAHVDPDLRSARFPVFQGRVGRRCAVAALGAGSGDYTVLEAAALMLDMPIGTDPRRLGELLVRGEHTLTFPEIEDMAIRTDRGDVTGVVAKAHIWNHAFVESQDAKCGVELVAISRREEGWVAYHRDIRSEFWLRKGALLVRRLTDLLLSGEAMSLKN